MGAGTIISLSVLLVKEADQWVARCLQYDVAGQGDTLDEALESLGLCLTGHVLMNVRDKLEPLAGLPNAPPRVWALFDRAWKVDRTHPFRMPAELDEIPEGLRGSMPEPWQLPRPTASDVRIY
jgi:hypothetical protein